MKKFIAFLSTFTIAACACTFSVTADVVSDELAGDVNSDGAVTSADIVMLSEFLLGANYNITKPDVNNDGDGQRT